MDIILNQIAIWRPFGSEKILKREAPLGQSFKIAGNPVIQSSQKPLFRYAKDFSRFGVKFCLFVRTFEEDITAVEKALDDAAKSLKKAEILNGTSEAGNNSFVYLDKFIGGAK